MSFRAICLVLIYTFCTVTGFGEDRGHSSFATLASATNRLDIHLQEGFSGIWQVLVTVDGREVYGGRPKTLETIGLAAMIQVTNAIAHPIVAFRIPSTNVTWSNRVDLSKGRILGFSVIDSRGIRVLQSTNFFYD